MLEQIRQYRIHILGVSLAAFDLGGTLLISYLIAKKLNINPLLIMGSSIPFSYAVHRLVKVDTPLTKSLNA